MPREMSLLDGNGETMRLLKETEVRELMQCSARTVQNLRKRKLLVHFRIGRAIRYDIRDVEAALKKLKVDAHR
jgi:hypothetical protein